MGVSRKTPLAPISKRTDRDRHLRTFSSRSLTFINKKNSSHFFQIKIRLFKRSHFKLLKKKRPNNFPWWTSVKRGGEMGGGASLTLTQVPNNHRPIR